MNCFTSLVQAPIPSAGIEPVVLVHGGAGDIPDETVPAKRDGVKLAARIGYETLRCTGSVLDAVQEAVRSMELNAHFNCGYGSVLTWDGKVEMEAAIMNGADLEAGCVSLVRDINHPIVLARRIMQKTPHRFLVGEGAMKFAVQEGFEILAECALVTPAAMKALQDFKTKTQYGMAQRNSCLPICDQPNNTVPEATTALNEQRECNCFPFPCGSCQQNFFGNSGGRSPGTVGAVAIDRFGNVAAATSTGGITGKTSGRIGDSPILGGGTYADNSCGAVSCTGHGEAIMRFNVASRILAQIQLGAQSAQNAVAIVLNEMIGRLNQSAAGVICIDRNGDVGIDFNTRRMPWAYKRDIQMHFGVEKGEDCMEISSASCLQNDEFKCSC